MIPIGVQRYLQKGNYQNDPGVAPFGVEHFLKNTVQLFKSFWGFNTFFPYNSLLAWISLAMLIAACVLFVKRKIVPSEKTRLFLYVAAAVIAASMLITLSFYFGRSEHPSSARYFVFFSLLIAAGPVYFHRHFPSFFGEKALLLVALISFFLCQPNAVEARFTNTLYLGREFLYELKFVGNPEENRYLMINDRPGQFTALGYGAVDFNYANSRANEVINGINRHLYLKAYVFQKINYSSRQPIPENTLDPQYPLRTLQEIQLTESEYLRISSVTGPPPSPEPTPKNSPSK